MGSLAGPAPGDLVPCRWVAGRAWPVPEAEGINGQREEPVAQRTGPVVVADPDHGDLLEYDREVRTHDPGTQDARGPGPIHWADDGDESNGADGDGEWSAGEDAAVGVPTGVAVFGNEVAMRHYGEQSNTITHWTDFETGGHFAAMETPDLLVGEIRSFFRTVR